MNQLNMLKKMTDVVIDTGDIELIKKYCPQDATTNPSLILNSLNSPFYKRIINNAIKHVINKNMSYEDKIINASDKLIVNVGLEILKIIKGKVSTEIDARLSFNTDMSVKRARNIISLYEDSNISRSRVLIKLAATWEGIQAAKILREEKIKCNLTLLFSFAQAKACAQSKVFLISPFVGRVYDWYLYKKLIKKDISYSDPGVLFIKKIYNFYKKHNYKTIIMGASFRNVNQILSLAGCDKLTISPVLFEELKNKNFEVIKKLKNKYKNKNHKKPSFISESMFRYEHNEDAMAVEKLSEGIRQFSMDQIKLEKFLISNFN
ncbi:transaldolase [Buchnera aphidicola (Taiwanaphis decaspermi)]|uniref:transaldolase n=1 Tax=Buchnera aphidicola TaxID=9 RepID=UPI0031B8AA02